MRGKPCLGSWLAYGLGSMNDNLPTFIVLQTKVNPKENNQPVSSRLWGSGFLSSQYAGVGLRSGGDPVLFLTDPNGVDRHVRRKMLDAVEELNRDTLAQIGDPETNARISEYEMAYRMQTSVPELVDLSKEPQSTWDLYGPEAREARHVCLQLPARSAHGGTWGAIHADLQTRVGCPQQRHRNSSRSLSGNRSRLLCAGNGSQETRPSRRHACHLVRRVWSNGI